MSQVDAVRRRLVDPKSVEILVGIAAWGPFNRETIGDALVICGGDAVVTHKLFLEWLSVHERSHSYRLPEVSLLAYLRVHYPPPPERLPERAL